MADRTAEARRRNDRMIETLEQSGALTEPAVAAAFRAVLRHDFLPGRDLGEVYEDAAILTKVGAHGTAISSSSQPAIMAIMLEQLRPGPGRRVLEVGTGTGYNAALLEHLVSPGGRVVTLEFDAETCAQARLNLEAASVGQVLVVCADGAAGWPPEAPFDRIIVTAGAADLAPAWLDQLNEGGRLVVPLALGGPGQLSVAFVRRGRALVGDSLSWCGFLALRGELEAPADADDRLQELLALPGRPAEVALSAGDLRAGFEHWLALAEDGYVRLRSAPEDPLGFGLVEPGGLVRFDVRGDRLVATLHGAGEPALRRLLAAHQEWQRSRAGLEAFTVSAWPAAEAPPPAPGERVVRRERFSFRIRRR